MRCEDVREKIDAAWEEGFPVEVREHLAGCGACERYARDVRLVRAGLRALAEEAAPEASWGFAARLVRRWQAASQEDAAAAFLERVGRRFVYAASLLTLGLLLSLALTSSGPVRGPATDALMAQPEVVYARPDPLGEADAQELRDLLPIDLNQQSQKGPK
jgi:hypothetical protein